MGVLTLVRHGQASFMSDDYDKLSPLGERQARVLGDYWAARGVTFDRVYCGPLARQCRTAELVGEAIREAGLEWPDPVQLHELAEFPVEQLAKEYLPVLLSEDAELAQKIMAVQAAEKPEEKERLFMEVFEVVTDHWMEGRFNGDAVESWEAFTERVEKALAAMTGADHIGKRVAAFTSAGPMAVSTRCIMGAPAKAAMELAWVVRNAAITEFNFSERGVVLNCFNNIGHLTEAELITHR